jgi:hypothetical protein
MSRRRRKRLPNALIPIPNADKGFHEKWKPGRNLLNIPHPFRAVCLGPPNCGKSTLVKNIILRAKPQFEQVMVIHCDPDYTNEYNDVGAEMLHEIPAPQEWEGDCKTLVVLDDLEFKGASKDQKRNLDRLFGFVSTHKDISCILCSQDAFNVPPIVRRCSNLWVLWRSPDIDSMATCARKSGLGASALRNIFDSPLFTYKENGRSVRKPHDSLWIDMTDKTPAPLRKNGFTKIRRKE